MDDIAQANKFKTLGNECFAAKDYHKAAEYFTKAIDLNSEDHVFYSNRSACYANMNEYDKALVDAQICVDIKPDWAKGYLRRGLAEFYMKKYHQAEKTYQEGLKLEPNNQQLQEGLDRAREEIKKHPNEGGAGGIDKEKFFHEAMEKLKHHSETKHFFEDPDFVAKLNDVKSNPQNLSKYMDDEKVMKAFEVIKSGFKGGAGNTGSGSGPNASQPNASKVTVNSDAEAEKVKGNEEYKKKNFEQAIRHYDNAIQLNPNEPIYYNNKAAVYLEMKDADKVIELCTQAIKAYRADSNQTDKTKLSKAYNRMANAYLLKKDYDDAIKAYEHSLAEHLDQTVLDEIERVENLKAASK